MKQSQVKPGVRAMLSLGRRGAVAVTVESVFTAAGYRTYDGSVTLRDARFNCRDASGRVHVATARRLSPMPAPYVSTPSELAHISAFRCASDAMAQVIHEMSIEPGQTIDNGDTVITTTLHRLG